MKFYNRLLIIKINILHNALLFTTLIFKFVRTRHITGLINRPVLDHVLINRVVSNHGLIKSSVFFPGLINRSGKEDWCETRQKKSGVKPDKRSLA